MWPQGHGAQRGGIRSVGPREAVLGVFEARRVIRLGSKCPTQVMKINQDTLGAATARMIESTAVGPLLLA